LEEVAGRVKERGRGGVGEGRQVEEGVEWTWTWREG
jgi:hypothetical protein